LLHIESIGLGYLCDDLLSRHVIVMKCGYTVVLPCLCFIYMICDLHVGLLLGVDF